MDKTRLNVKLGSTFETISGTKRLRSAESVPLYTNEQTPPYRSWYKETRETHEG